MPSAEQPDTRLAAIRPSPLVPGSHAGGAPGNVRSRPASVLRARAGAGGLAGPPSSLDLLSDRDCSWHFPGAFTNPGLFPRDPGASHGPGPDAACLLTEQVNTNINTQELKPRTRMRQETE